MSYFNPIVGNIEPGVRRYDGLRMVLHQKAQATFKGTVEPVANPLERIATRWDTPSDGGWVKQRAAHIYLKGEFILWHNIEGRWMAGRHGGHLTVDEWLLESGEWTKYAEEARWLPRWQAYDKLLFPNK